MENNIQVLDKGFVRLVEKMGDDLSIVQAARVSFGQGSKGKEADRGLIKYLLDHEHGTPFEMVQFKFHVKCPIFVMRQWIRHRIGSFNECSARYTEIKEEFYIPEKWRGQSKENKQGSDGFIEPEIMKTYTDFVDENPNASEKIAYVFNQLVCIYKEMLREGVSREMARIILPLATYTEFYWSVNARSLMNFLKLRMDKHAQWEIQEYARAIFGIFKEILPWTAEFSGLEAIK